MGDLNPSPSFFHAPRPIDARAKELIGTVDEIRWVAADSSCVIAKLRTGETVKGPSEDEELAEGVTYRFLGRWEEHHKHGQQFAFQTFVKDAPHNRPGVIKYLIDEVAGVGRAKAERLWEAFGSDAVAVLRTDQARVAATGILTADQAAEAARDLTNSAALEKTKIDLFSLFVGRGFPGKLLSACIERWGARASLVIRRNPFILLTEDLPGAGFRRCDRLFLDLGGNRSKLKRQMLSAWNYMREDNDGHTWFPAMTLERKIIDKCGMAAAPWDAMVLGKRGGWMATRREPAGSKAKTDLWLAEYEKADAERRLAEKIMELCSLCVTRWPAIPTDAGFSEHQGDRTAKATHRPVGMLTGTPGTGKTYCAGAIIREVVKQYGSALTAACAPTGKAAVRLTASMRRYGVTSLEATTIHRLLEIGRNGHDRRGWGFQRNRDNPLDQRFIFVDEWSMGDTSLAASLFDACAPGTHVLLIGDSGQLPPVGHGAPLRDMLAGGLACGELSEIRRNAGMIVEACVAIRAGKPFKYCTKYAELDLRPENEGGTGKNLLHIETSSPEESLDALRVLLARWKRTGEFDPIWDAQPLVAMNDKSEVSRVPINRMLQGELNPEVEVAVSQGMTPMPADPAGKKPPRNPFRVNDKIICLKNGMIELADGFNDNQPNGDTYIANGEIGAVIATEPKVTYAKFMYPDRIVKILIGKVEEGNGVDGNGDGEQKGTGCDFALAYAVTCHKFQGSQCPAVIIMIDKEAARVASREWIYTAVSRAEKLTITIGSMSTMLRQCRKVSLTHRKTFLRELLQGINP